jgi:hypothetical protein
MGCCIYITNSDIDEVHFNLKLTLCPHCKKYGMLILHGYIYGLDEKRQCVIKGKRVYCSNRNRRSGCGQTIAYRFCNFIRQSFLSSQTAWKFLSNILSGSSIESSYNSLDTSYTVSLSALYLLWKKFRNKISETRSMLANKIQITDSSKDCPFRETIYHLNKLEHTQYKNPIEAFQIMFQSSIF